MFTDAMTVLQDLLDRQSRALLAADMDVMRDTVLFPYRRITSNVDVIIENEADMRRAVQAFHDSLSSLGVNHLIRLVTEAEYLSADYIEGRYVTHALRNAANMVPSYSNRIVLRYAGEAWRMIEAESDLVATTWPLSLLRVADPKTVPPFRTLDEDVRRSTTTPIALYQTFLDALTAASVKNDFKAYVDLCDLPYTSHSDKTDLQIRTADDIKPFFDMTVDMIKGEQADTFRRVAKDAQFLGPDLICGYHDSLFSKAGAPVMAPIKSRMILKRRGVIWKLKHVTNALANDTYPYTAPEPTEALLTHQEIQERTKSWPTLH